MKVIQDQSVHLMKKFIILFIIILKINSFLKGFLCPICHRKFPDTNGLERHYLQAHSEPQAGGMYENTNGTRNSTKHEQIEVKINY